ncbi:hypothetical protein [Streptomyces sp. NPDC006739]|uniref:hypothetical protein n=1 Tax=Streptomyces sp. NPDC006739 TaxID=3364763 RepID=UPI0036B7A80C
MRTFHRAATVAAAVAVLSALGAGAGFADDNDPPQPVTAVASPQVNAVVVWVAPHHEPRSDPHRTHHRKSHHGRKHDDHKHGGGKHDDHKHDGGKHAKKRHGHRHGG